ncbi:IS110 family transposase [Neobacillus pocheonensis]|uniref:IS110 family transposase n=1 Tax=Neobacillus pocheonensis TaxID=363869 RepID=A0ABT0WFX5_9BACI|nr:IS110 family transposase [Neobacillus pocheonensis]MCM2534697.1 IS110 family transposase [Neobacillus pocheonensis]MCM2534779.1 IS110 family transposase [Neobacillus pocheonensis]
MKDVQKFVGLDVSKDTIAVAIADPGRGEPRFHGTIQNKPEDIRKLMKKLGNHENLLVCYEAGPTGYGIYRLLLSLDIECMVVAPSLIPKRSGDRVKTDKRDSTRLAQLLRAGELTSVWVPDEDHEALRDLIRARHDAREDLQSSRQRLVHLLLRHEIRPPQGVRNWSVKHREWLKRLTFERASQRIVFQEYLHAIYEVEERMKRLEAQIHEEAIQSEHAPVIQALQTLRGVAEVTAVTLVAEIGQFSRFSNPRQLMSYAGLVPKEYSSGSSRWQGSITKTGNAQIRRSIVEVCWSYRHRPSLKGELLKRQEGQDPEAKRIAWKAQHRLHMKYHRISAKGKGGKVAVVAVARELLGFIWAIGCAIEDKQVIDLNVA